MDGIERWSGFLFGSREKIFRDELFTFAVKYRKSTWKGVGVGVSKIFLGNYQADLGSVVGGSSGHVSCAILTTLCRQRT